MNYDQWKAQELDDLYDDPPCDHDEWDIDWEGRITCGICGDHLRWATAEEMERHAEWQREYYEQMERQEWRDRWMWWWDRPREVISNRWFLLKQRWEKPQSAVVDDEIPF